MGSLDRYARKPQEEKRTEHVGGRIEPSLFENFTKLCDQLGLTVSETIRYMIVNTVNEYKHKMENKDKQSYKKVKSKVNKRK
jgi:antitoxin component of RelBE/YafQ-DinJ toxin-antitoxin module